MEHTAEKTLQQGQLMDFQQILDCWKDEQYFAVVAKLKNKSKIYKVIKTSTIGIKRHKKIKADENPYMKE